SRFVEDDGRKRKPIDLARTDRDMAAILLKPLSQLLHSGLVATPWLLVLEYPNAACLWCQGVEKGFSGCPSLVGIEGPGSSQTVFELLFECQSVIWSRKRKTGTTLLNRLNSQATGATT